MKNCLFVFIVIQLLLPSSSAAQDKKEADKRTKDIYTLIDNYSIAREKKDTLLLKTILTQDVDQLVSTGEWRDGLGVAVQGMLRSSATSPGTRTLTVEKVRFLDSKNAIADARYEIKNPDGSTRKMWSTFVVVQQKGDWKIAAIRNMLPSAQP
ncbi:MAG TPA: DUF4440 domain-containing protein [Chitinophagaceae bacterium]|nr:DUF4440 domain-containing protein [Chitinophagaceae bacterium]